MKDKENYKSKPFFDIVPKSRAIVIPCEGHVGFAHQVKLIIDCLKFHPELELSEITAFEETYFSGKLSISFNQISKEFKYDFPKDDYIDENLTKNLNHILQEYNISDVEYISCTWDEIGGAYAWALIYEDEKEELEYYWYINLTSEDIELLMS